ncbi:hypothetical protein FHU38_000413 [Saccharomonospora amisosensis]|uniref:Uncharacterized protein n=1 Tax=Saccharomonospora amisosensis TaxID=1128677 RepID=A0A7X5UL87_9PSEU|nr:hypothetical protein [Saccharomonospora amisosensis]NIJ10069.1 hypothetical protein [Saccharomonospora amisosensis]
MGITEDDGTDTGISFQAMPTPFEGGPVANADGTQAPEPPRSYTDPLSGLVTGGRPGFTVKGEREESLDVRIADPVEPDPDMVRQMVDATLAAEERARTGDSDGAKADPATADAGSGQQQSTPAGVYPQQQRAWPARSQLLPPMLRLRQRSSEDEGEDKPRKGPQSLRKPSSGSAGLAVALVLLVLFIVIAIQFLASLFGSISGLFG